MLALIIGVVGATIGAVFISLGDHYQERARYFAYRYDKSPDPARFEQERSQRSLADAYMSGGIVCLILGVLCAAIGIAGSQVLLYRAWALIQDDHARTSPGKAVLFLFIPPFNLYWVFEAYVGLANDMNDYARRHKIAAPPVSARLALTSCIMVLIPFVNLLATIPYLLLMNKVKNAAIAIKECKLAGVN